MNIERVSLNKYKFIYREEQSKEDSPQENDNENEEKDIYKVSTFLNEDDHKPEFEHEANPKETENTIDADIHTQYNHITVKHLVISGGGTLGFIVYGFLRDSYGLLWHHSKLESLYATSVGSLISTFIALNIEWSILDAYIINRPWHQVFQFDFKHILYSVNNCGIFNIDIFKQILDPLLKFKELDVNITLKEFYEWNHFDMHFYVTEIYAEDGSYFKKIDISHKTHPDWKLVDAVYASCALPVAFSPYSKDNCIYIDGGILNTYPVNDCIHNIKITENTKNEICAFQLTSLDNKATNCKEKKEIIKCSLIDLLIFIIIHIIYEFTSQKSIVKLKYEFEIKSSKITGFEIHLASSDAMIRRKLITEGSELWNTYFANMSKNNDESTENGGFRL
jgi:predicted acylesterase/phospholipase RssA